MKTKFSVGDQVFHMGYGVGEVTEISDERFEAYPITVEFTELKEDPIRSFTLDGRYEECELVPTLLNLGTALMLGLVKDVPRKFWHIVIKDGAGSYTLSRPFTTEKEALENTDADEQVVSLTVKV